MLGVIGTYVGAKREVDPAEFAEMEVRSLTRRRLGEGDLALS